MSFKLDFRASLEGDTEIKRKFEDLEQALQDVKKAAEDTSKPVEDTAKAMDDLGKSAGDVDKDLKDTSGALDDVSKSAGDITKDLDDTAKSFDDVSKSAVDVSSDLKDADSAFNDIASNADGAVSSMDAVKSSFEGISESAVEADQNIAAATTGLEGVGTATESAAAGADSLATSLDNIAASAQEAETNISAAANGIDGIGTSIGQAETALDGLGSAFDGAGTSTTTFNDVLSSTGTQAQAASGGLTPLNTVLGQVGGATQQASGGFQGFNTNIGIMTGFIGTAASGAIQFVSALNNLHGAQIKVEATQAKLSTSTEAVNKAQQKLNDLLASGTATTEEIEQATLDLSQATDKNNIAIERAGKAQDDLNIKYAKFATDSLPGLIQSVTSTIAVVSQLHDKFGDLKLEDIAAGFGVVGLSIAAVGVALKGLQTGPSTQKLLEAIGTGDIEKVNAAWKEYRESVGQVPAVNEVLGTSLDSVTGALQKGSDEAEVMNRIFPTLKTGAKTAGDEFQVTGTQTKTMGSEFQLGAQDAATLANMIGQVPEVQEKLNASMGAGASATASAGVAVKDYRGIIEEARGGIDGFVEKQRVMTENSETLKVKLHELNEASTENINQTMELVGSTENYNDALLTVGQSIADHQVKIDQLNQTLGTAEGQQLSFTNAVLAGEEKFLTWVQTTQDAAVEAATFKGKLDEVANTFNGLPGWIEPTVENLKLFIRSNKEGGDAAKEFARLSLESYRGLVEGAKPLFDDLKAAWGKVRAGIWEEGEAEGELIDPVLEAFKKLPPAVAATLDQVELKALSFSAEFAAVGEEAGTGWANNLKAHIDMGETFDQALAAANQAAADILAPFIAEHPEAAQMIQPLIDALQTGTPEAVRAALESLAGMQGPFQEEAQGMLTQWNTMTGQLGPSMKTGVEGSIQELGVKMEEIFSNMTDRLLQGIDTIVNGTNTKLDTIKKKDPVEVKLNKEALDRDMGIIQGNIDNVKKKTPVDIAVNQGGLNMSLSSIQQGIDNVRQNTPIQVTANAEQATGAISSVTTAVNGIPASKAVSVTADTTAATGAISGVTTAVNAIPASKSVSITADASGALGASASVTTSINSITQTNTPNINANDRPGVEASGRVQGGIDNIRQQVAPTVDVNTAAAEAKIQALGNAIARLGAGAYGQAGVSLSGTGYSGGYPGQAYPGMNYARGFGPAIVNQPMRMLVGEAGPEFVSVIPLKGNRQYPQAGRQQYTPTKTAAAGMGWYGPSSGGLGYGAIPRTNTYAEAAYLLQQAQGGMQQGAMQGSEQGSMQGAQQGTQQGFDQSMPGMQQAVQEGAAQGTQQGMQQGYQQGGYGLTAQNAVGFGSNPRTYQWGGGAMGTSLGMGGGAGQYPEAPSNTEIWGAGRFTWGGGAAGAQLGGMGGGGAQYPTAGVPLGPEHAIGFGSRPVKYTWGGGASGTTLTPHGPHVGAGLPGPDPYAFGGSGGGNPYAPGGAYSQPGGGVPEYRGVPGQSYGGNTMGQGYRMPGYEGTSDAEYERRLLAERDRVAKERGTTMGSGASKNFVKAFDAGVEGQSQNINGVSATILSGNAGPARQAGNEAGTAAGQGFAEGFNSQMGGIDTKGITQGQAGYPKAYTGEVPASYGKPLGQLNQRYCCNYITGARTTRPTNASSFWYASKT